MTYRGRCSYLTGYCQRLRSASSATMRVPRRRNMTMSTGSLTTTRRR
jgi:hypothetical protein